MTPTDRFDRDLQGWLATTAPQIAPDLLHEQVMERARGSRQRPVWRARLSVRSTGPRGAQVGRLARRSALVLAVVALVLAIAAAAILVGSAQRLPPPFGLAGNGLIALDSGSSLFLVDPETWEVEPLSLNVGEASAPRWSPDGRRFAFWVWPATGLSLSVSAPDGSDRIDVPFEDDMDVNPDIAPAWSPDSTRLVFAATKAGVTGLWVIDLGTRSLRPLPVGPVRPLDPAWSPDGEWISFVGISSRNSNDQGIWIIHPDGSGLELLPTSGFLGYFSGVGAPKWAPGSGQLALLYGIGQRFETDIAIFDLTARREVIVSADFAAEFWPTWSPDGTKVAWYHTTAAEGRDAIRVVELDADFRPIRAYNVLEAPPVDPGEGPNCAAQPSMAERFICTPPFWSPDGQSIFAFDVLGTSLMIVRVDRSTTHAPRVINLSAGVGGSLSWQRTSP